MCFPIFYGSSVSLLYLQDSTLTLPSVYALSPWFLQIHFNIAVRPTPMFHGVSLLFQPFNQYFSVSFIFPFVLPFLPFSFSLCYCTLTPIAYLKSIISEYPCYVMFFNPMPVRPASLKIFSLVLCYLNTLSVLCVFKAEQL